MTNTQTLLIRDLDAAVLLAPSGPSNLPVRVAAGVGGVTIGTPGLTAGSQRRWSSLTAQLERLRGLYEDQVVIESDHLEKVVQQYFKDCWDVKDWLRKDAGLGADLLEKAERLALTSAPLRLGGALGHSGDALALSGGMAIQARCFRVHGTNTAVIVSYWSQARWRQTIDALDLAERCHRDWLSVLA